MRWMNRRAFVGASIAATAGAVIGSRRPAWAADAPAAAPRVRPNILYALRPARGGASRPLGRPLPLVTILDETAAAGFNGVRLTGYPGILEQNHLTVEQYAEELARRA